MFEKKQLPFGIEEQSLFIKFISAERQDSP